MDGRYKERHQVLEWNAKVGEKILNNVRPVDLNLRKSKFNLKNKYVLIWDCKEVKSRSFWNVLLRHYFLIKYEELEWIREFRLEYFNHSDKTTTKVNKLFNKKNIPQWKEVIIKLYNY